MQIKRSERSYELANLHAVLAAYSQFRANLESALEQFDVRKSNAHRQYVDNINVAHTNVASSMNQSLMALRRQLDDLNYDNNDDEDDDE